MLGVCWWGCLESVWGSTNVLYSHTYIFGMLVVEDKMFDNKNMKEDDLLKIIKGDIEAEDMLRISRGADAADKRSQALWDAGIAVVVLVFLVIATIIG